MYVDVCRCVEGVYVCGCVEVCGGSVGVWVCVGVWRGCKYVDVCRCVEGV